MNKIHIECLEKALGKLLGKPIKGTMAYIRCLSSDIIEELFNNFSLNVNGWQIYTVSDEQNDKSNFITSDCAVDLRERKEGSILLFVDKKHAGPGMDGIYSAVREIGEKDLLKSLSNIALKKLEIEQMKFVEIAVKRARKIGRLNTISPWQEFDFYCNCAFCPNNIGQYINLIGLWPIDNVNGLDESELEVAAQMTERLLIKFTTSNTIKFRIDSLLLNIPTYEQLEELEDFLYASESKKWTEAVLSLNDKPSLWINKLKPDFQSPVLREIELQPWWKDKSKPYTWSGLKWNEEENIPVFYISKDEDKTGKLEVRWKTKPFLKSENLVYKVSIITGSDDELIRKSVNHSGRNFEKCVFTREDMEEDLLEENGKWEVFVRVHPIGQEYHTEEEKSLLWKETENFVFVIGEKVDDTVESTVGKKSRALVEEAIKVAQDDFDRACQSDCYKEDKKGYISFLAGGKSGRVFRPPLIKDIETDWFHRNFEIGRWIIQVREDGSRSGKLDFCSLKQEISDLEIGKKLDEATRQLGRKAMEKQGFIGFVHHKNDYADRYVNTWISTLDQCNPGLALANTIEVQTQGCETIGLIVLPCHPLRIAWHQAYDELAYYMTYEENLKPANVVTTLKAIDGSYFPMFLPGLKEGRSFVFGDNLGFYTVGMIRDREQEPQAKIALMARCLTSISEDMATSVGKSTADAISQEIDKYSKIHQEYKILKINTLRPGDGLTVVRALGLAIIDTAENEDEDNVSQASHQGYILDMFPSSEMSKTRLVGRYLSEMAERRRSGVSGISSECRWMWENYDKDGIPIPRLRWSKRSESEPKENAHLTIAFDTFESSIIALSEESFSKPRPIEGFGLFPSLIKTFTFEPVPTWITTIASQTDGDKHPTARGLSERLQKIHTVILKSVAINLGKKANSWPVIRTEVTAEKADSLKRLHELSDWVITVDRNTSIEFFDAPKENPEIYDTYVIDCIPERQDLDSVQLITSTSQLEEIMILLDQSLSDMGLSCSPRNCNFLLKNLKAISGRLAMRLSGQKQSKGELIALALFYSSCEKYYEANKLLSLRKGFLLPIDDIQDLLIKQMVPKDKNKSEEKQSSVRADLIYVDLTKKGLLRFTFIEVKYRRLLRACKDIELIEYIYKQTSNTRDVFYNSYFSSKLINSQKAIRRKRLARALQFYCNKSRRHILEEDSYNDLCRAIDKLYTTEIDISDECDDRGYIFCPEYTGEIIEVVSNGCTSIYLFGPSVIPDIPALTISNIEMLDLKPTETDIIQSDMTNLMHGTTIIEDNTNQISLNKSIDTNKISLLLGHKEINENPVSWDLSIRGNPHLMIVGLPGMGKTTCIINLCQCLFKQNIIPIVFSYHEDIETKLEKSLGNLHFIDMERGLGFNPLRVVGKGAHAWVDNVGMLRDIFSSIYPDLGDLQTNEIREAIKESYTKFGYGNVFDPSKELPVPEFQTFFDILKNKKKPNPGIIARLEELNDYGFFQKVGTEASLLQVDKPCIIRVHTNQNEVIQNALASFVLFSIYQNMFLRGEQKQITHTVIFDEAHRASKLKLLPTMAKECRKYGISLIVSSQAAKDFSLSLYSAIANYLVLRVIEADANSLAKNVVQSTDTKRIAGKLKQLGKYTSMFFCEGKPPVQIKLASPVDV